MWMREVLGGRDLSAVSCQGESGAEAGSCEGLMGGDEVVEGYKQSINLAPVFTTDAQGGGVGDL